MGHHIDTKTGKFISDKYRWCPVGFFALKFTDPLARMVIGIYANRTEDLELAEDLRIAIGDAEKDFFAGMNSNTSTCCQ